MDSSPKGSINPNSTKPYPSKLAYRYKIFHNQPDVII